MALRKHVLVIDQDAAFRRYAKHVLSGMDFEVVEATSGRAGMNELQQWTPDCVLVDLELTDVPGFDIIQAVSAELAPRPPVVAMSASLGVSDAVLAMKAGAKDVTDKPIDTERLKQMVLAAMDNGELAKEVAAAERPQDEGCGNEILVAESPQMRGVLDRVERLAAVEMPVLIIGEPGTGAASLARHLHTCGPRAARPFVIVPESDSPAAVEAAVFGTNGCPSAFAQAHGGTVFISSLVSLGPSGQERLGRVLAEVAAARASGHPVSCPRIVVGCHRDLSSEVSLGRVREDLAHRLSPLTLNIPSLRERRKDIPELVRRIADRSVRSLGRGPVNIADDVMKHLSERDWLGNVSELQSAVVRGVVLAREGRMRIEDIVGPKAASVVDGPGAGGRDGWRPTLDDNGSVRRFDDYEAEIFRFALDKAGGCVSRAAETLGVGRATMYRKMRSYDIDAPPVSERAIIRTGRRSKRKKDQLAAEFIPGRAA